MFGLGLLELLILFGIPSLGLLLLTPIPAWFIVKKAGFPPAWGLLAVLPVINILALWVLAFIPWPARGSEGASRDRPDPST